MKPSDEARRRAGAASQRRLTPEEADAYLATLVSAAEREDVLVLVRWFRRRYATGAERLAYVRRASRRWRGPADEQT